MRRRLLVATALLFPLVAALSHRITAGEADIQTMNISIASYTNNNTVEVNALWHLKDILEKRSGGKISAAVFHSGTVGGETDLAEQVRTGAMEISLGGFPVIETYARKYSSFLIPYLYSDKAGVLRSWNGRIGDAIKKSYASHGIYAAGLILRGNRQLTANKPVQTVGDLKGMKLRLPETASWVAVWNQLGCIPTPIPGPEIFSALQTGVVEAQENPISSNAMKGLQEVQKYTMLTNHVVDILTLNYSKKWFDTLNADTQNFIKQCMAEAIEVGNAEAIRMESEYRRQMEEGGMQFLEIPDISEFRKVALSVIKDLSKDWEPWVLEQAVADASGE